MVNYRPRPHRQTTNRLRLYRADRRFTQDDVAIRLGHHSRFRYWQIENEEILPTTRERAKLAKIFHCTEADLFPNSPALVTSASASTEVA